MQHSAVHRSLPHQTGVTERSIRDSYRDAIDDIVKDVVIRHLADWISAGVAAETDGEQNHFHLCRVCFAGSATNCALSTGWNIHSK